MTHEPDTGPADGLPVDPGSVRSVAVYGAVSPAAESTAALFGGACFLAEGRWSLWVPADPQVTPLTLAVALSRSRGRRDRAMWLWQDGDAAGYLLLAARRTVDVHTWTAAPATEEAPDRRGDAAALAAWADRPDLEVPLRALLRRRGPATALIPQLVALLGLPPAVPDVLAGRIELAALPGARWREKESAWSLSLAEERQRVANQPSWKHRTWLVVAGLAAAFGVVLTIVELAALAGVDAAGQGSVLSLLRFAGFTGVMSWLAARRYRRLRART